MRHQEGLPISLVEEGLLDAAGILTGQKGCTNAYGLPDEAIQLFLLIAAQGEQGLARSRVPKDLREKLDEHLLPLELQMLVSWERDNRGRLAYLVLTWKGEEAIAAARQSHVAGASSASMGARRRRRLD